MRLFEKGIAVPIKITPKPRDDFKEWIKEAKSIILEYLDKLYEWRDVYRPHNSSENFHPLFVESLQKTDYIEYLADILSRGTENEKREFYEQGFRPKARHGRRANRAKQVIMYNKGGS